MRRHTLLDYEIEHVNVELNDTGVVATGRPGHVIHGVNWALVAASAVKAQFRSGETGGATLGGAINAGTVGAAPGEAIETGHFNCSAPGADLELVMSAATNVIGYVVVAHVPVAAWPGGTPS